MAAPARPLPLRPQVVGPYHQALIRGRRIQQTLDRRALEGIRRALDEAVDDALDTYRAATNAGEAAAAGARLKGIRQLTDTLSAKLDAAISGPVQLTRIQILDAWQKAQRTYERSLPAAARAESAAITDAIRAAARAPLAPGLDRAAAFAARGGVSRTWKTALQGYVNGAGQDLDEILANALANKVDAKTLAKALRPYVRGAEQFHKAFGAQAFDKLRDLRKVPKAYHNAARELEYNARRIAETEIQQARLDADARAFLEDPHIKAAKWTRGSTWGDTCGCDALASNNLYGMGVGVYPLRRVPSAPHPFCKCRLVPVLAKRPLTIDQKPDPQRRRGVAQAKLARETSQTRPSQVRAAKEQALRAISVAEASRGTAPLPGATPLPARQQAPTGQPGPRLAGV